jgi:hypothetical protein
LIHVATLYPNHCEISQDTVTAACGQILTQGIAKSSFSKVGTSKLDVTGTAFLGKP